VVFLADGQIVQELRNPDADEIFEYMKNLDETPATGGFSRAPKEL
jgi:putative ABC transport system ATP-binding protein